jgi:hypothetical protein
LTNAASAVVVVSPLATATAQRQHQRYIHKILNKIITEVIEMFSALWRILDDYLIENGKIEE